MFYPIRFLPRCGFALALLLTLPGMANPPSEPETRSEAHVGTPLPLPLRVSRFLKAGLACFLALNPLAVQASQTPGEGRDPAGSALPPQVLPAVLECQFVERVWPSDLLGRPVFKGVPVQVDAWAQDGDGGRTISIHIQAHRDGKGEGGGLLVLEGPGLPAPFKATIERLCLNDFHRELGSLVIAIEGFAQEGARESFSASLSTSRHRGTRFLLATQDPAWQDLMSLVQTRDLTFSIRPMADAEDILAHLTQAVDEHVIDEL